VFDVGHPAVEGTLDELARAGLATDWGARMLSKESTLYEPLSYNNGASWPFLTGWAALALYRGGRPDAAWQYLDALADLTFLEGRGYIPELFSGDRLRSLDAAVPHQLFATAGFVSGVMRGLLGFEEGETGLRLAPVLPPGWGFLRVRNLRWRDARGDLEIRRDARGSVTFEMTGTTTRRLPVVLDPPLPPGARRLSVGAAGGVSSPSRTGAARAIPFENRARVTFSAGITLAAEQAPLALGNTPQRLRIVETRVENNVYTARLQGRRGRTYRVRLNVPFAVSAIEGGREVGRDGRVRTIAVAVPDGPVEWVDCQLVVRLGARLE
jgi:hypothetical protein